MPELTWIGKEHVIAHHLEVPYRVLERRWSFDAAAGRQAADNGSGNMVIRGDNLHALKSLLPRYAGRVKCIYIDPPYNTGNEGWVYNDNVNAPQIKKWLGEVVGKEGEDLSRHDKWLCMMYPRLKLLHKLLAEDGVIFISIDDNEQASLKLVCDEIFGASNFLADLIWQHSVQSNGYAGKFVSQYNHILVFQKSPNFILKNLPRSDEDDKLYKNPDNDPRGAWRAGYCVNGLYRPNLKYDIVTPSGKRIEPPEKGWRWSKETLQQKIDAGEIIFNEDETKIIHKLYLADLDGKVPENLWSRGIAGTTRQANAELKQLFDGKAPFDTPKPTALVERILQIATDKDSIVLDSFAGSGTTAHAVLKQNAEDGGNRRFILVEMEDYAESITAERVQRVIAGYGEGKNAVPGTGGGFSFYELGEPLLFADGNLNEAVGAARIREYVWHRETKLPAMPDCASVHPYLLGVHNGAAYWFYYVPQQETVLDMAFLATLPRLPEAPERHIIYADAHAFGDEQLERWGIEFKKIPRDIPKL